jgi:hypothetical protein
VKAKELLTERRSPEELEKALQNDIFRPLQELHQPPERHGERPAARRDLPA